MENEEKIKHSFIESPIAKWFSIIVACVGLLGFIYDHFSENNPDLTFTIIKETSLLNNKANIPSIRILLDSIDIRETHSNISIYTIKVENEGKQHITKSMYDGNIQLILKQGEYISLPNITYASSIHIKPHFSDSSLLSNKKTLNLPCVPMDKDNVYLFDIIVLHSIDTIPTFIARGKISGQKEISVNRGINDKPSFMKITFGGGILANIVRLIVYFIFGNAIFVIILISIDKISKEINKYKLKIAVQKIISRHAVSKGVVEDIRTLKRSELRSIYKWINTTDEEATRRYAWLQRKLSENSKVIDRYTIEEGKIVKIMIEKGYLKKSQEQITINKSMQNDFKYIYKRLKKQNLLNLESLL